MSESTVKSHIARIYQKLGASNRAQALVTAMRIGLLSSVQRTRVLRAQRRRRVVGDSAISSQACARMVLMDYDARIESRIRTGAAIRDHCVRRPPAFSALKRLDSSHL